MALDCRVMTSRVGDFRVTEQLAAACARAPERTAWLHRLPTVVRELVRRWSLTLGPPLDSDEATASWLAPAERAGGTRAILKLGLPHMEADHEIAGLRFWAGDPTVRLLEADEDRNAMLLERCEPGTVLRTLPEPEQDEVLARLLRRLWRPPAAPHPFRPLSVMTALWSEETRRSGIAGSADPGLVREGLRLLEELPASAPEEVLLATDLHAGNVLRARREPWLVIDPKPFVGDPAYDATQHLLNCVGRLRADPAATIERFAGLLGLESDRVRLWLFARAAAEPGAPWDDESMSLARELAS